MKLPRGFVGQPGDQLILGPGPDPRDVNLALAQAAGAAHDDHRPDRDAQRGPGSPFFLFPRLSPGKVAGRSSTEFAA